MAVHSGSHPAYSSFISGITESFEIKHKAGDLGGKTEQAWLKEFAKKLNGLVTHLRFELAHSGSNYHLKINDNPHITPDDLWCSLADEWDVTNLDFKEGNLRLRKARFTRLVQNGRITCAGSLFRIRQTSKASAGKSF